MVAALAPTYRGPSQDARRRMVSDRFRRIWAVVTAVAEFPGWSRRQLADRYFLSERQIQADLNVIRTDMRLPLVRERGYRFVAEGAPADVGSLDLAEAQLLVMVLRQARQDRTIPRERLDTLLTKLPGLFPPHLQRIVARMIEAVTAAPSPRQQVFAALGEALVRGLWVTLHRQPCSEPLIDVPNPIVKPELILPYLDRWYLLADVRERSGSSRMFDLETVTAVTLAEVSS